MNARIPLLARAARCSAATALWALQLLQPALAATEDRSKATGYLAATVIIPAVITWFFARRAKPGWSWPRIILTFLALLVIVGIAQTVGRSAGRG